MLYVDKMKTQTQEAQNFYKRDKTSLCHSSLLLGLKIYLEFTKFIHSFIDPESYQVEKVLQGKDMRHKKSRTGCQL